MRTPTPSRSIPRLARTGAALALALGLGCAPSAPPAGRPRAGAPLEDALAAGFLPATAVDRLAEPLAPIRPAYPARMRALGLEGEVSAEVGVKLDGSAGPARVVASSHHDFTRALREALRSARFRAAEKDGHPVPSWLPLRVRFELAE
jgi:TonB family protein